MRVCPACAHENDDDTDFCEKCRTYLRWEPTSVIRLPPRPPEPEAPPAEEAGGAAAAAAPAAPAAPAPEPPRAATSINIPPVSQPTYLLSAAPLAGAGAPPPASAEVVVVSLRAPDVEGSGDEEVTAQADAGGRSTVIVLIRNQSGIVDNYSVGVNGVPAEWWTATPATVYLVPYGSPGGTYEEEVELSFHPPRSAEAEARSWPIEVVAHSKARDDDVGSAAATLVITPYQQLESELRPVTATGRRKAGFTIAVRNSANAPIETIVSAIDAEGACDFEFVTPRFLAEPGHRAGTSFSIRPRKQIWIGRSVDRRFEVVARAADGDASAAPHQAVFRQKPWLPWWTAPLVPLVVVAVILAIMLWPKSTRVPDLNGKKAIAAAAILEEAGLKLAPEAPAEKVANAPGGTIVGTVPAAGKRVKKGTVVQITVAQPAVPKLIGRTPPQARLALAKRGLKLSSTPPQKKVSTRKAGTIVGQIPGAGRRLPTGSEVAIVVAVGSSTRKVPNVSGLTPAQADSVIRAAKLTMVLTLPAGVDPAKAKISSQIPAAGEVVKLGSPVSVFVPAPVKPKPPTVSSAAGLSAAAAAAALEKKGAVVTTVRRIDPAPVGTVIGQTPPPGAALKPGQKVQLLVSAGYPDIAFGRSGDLEVMRGVDGTGVTAAAGTGDLEDQPSWQPRGALIAYRRGPRGNSSNGKVWLVTAAKPSSAHPLTTGADDRSPAFSPDGKVVAFIRRNVGAAGNDKDLCFARVSAAPVTGACIVDPKLDVDRPTWASDGSAIVVVATDPADADQTELLEYTSPVPSSSRPSDWVSRGLVTNGMHGKRRGEKVLAAAWGPNGKQLAIVANWGAARLASYSVFLSPSSRDQIGRPREVDPAIRACEVAWRSDSGELAVMQASDCARGSGAIVRVNPASPTKQVTLVPSGGKNPAWEFVSLGGS